MERLPGVEGEAPLAPGELLRQEDGTSPIPAAIVPGRTLSPRARGGAMTRGGERPAADPRLRLRSAKALAPTPRSQRRPVAEDGGSSNGHPTIIATGDAIADPADAAAGPAARLRLGRVGWPRGTTRRPGWRRSRRSSIGLALDDPRPRRGIILGLAVGRRRRPPPGGGTGGGPASARGPGLGPDAAGRPRRQARPGGRARPPRPGGQRASRSISGQRCRPSASTRRSPPTS